MSLDVAVVTPPVAAQPAVSWGAILAGAAAALAISLALMFLGTAFGLTQVSPWPSESVSPTTFAVQTAIGLILIQWISAVFGGFIAGRLRAAWTDVGGDEIYFRNTVHGFLAWCAATIGVFGCAAILATAAAHGGAQAVGAAAGGAASAAASSGGAGTGGGAPNLAAYYADTLYRGATGQPQENADYRGETARIIAASVASGEISQNDRAYLAQQIAARTGVAPEEAQKRVNDLAATLQNAKQKAQETAEQARKAASRGALFTFLALLVGAFLASAAGAYGGQMRDQ